MRGLQNHSLHMLVLDKELGLELSIFSRQLKLKPGINDDHRVIEAMPNDLWFRRMEIKEGEKRQNSKETKDHLEALVLRKKPEDNKWLHLTPRIAALGADDLVDSRLPGRRVEHSRQCRRKVSRICENDVSSNSRNFQE